MDSPGLGAGRGRFARRVADGEDPGTPLPRLAHELGLVRAGAAVGDDAEKVLAPEPAGQPGHQHPVDGGVADEEQHRAAPHRVVRQRGDDPSVVATRAEALATPWHTYSSLAAGANNEPAATAASPPVATSNAGATDTEPHRVDSRDALG